MTRQLLGNLMQEDFRFQEKGNDYNHIAVDHKQFKQRRECKRSCTKNSETLAT
jgi:hypothetical protein